MTTETMNAPNESKTTPSLTRKDFQTDQDVRWCPGCGDYSILAAVQKVFPELGIPKENFAIVSGIGCAARFPYYVDTYGFHTIHGRALSIATGLKVSRPELSVWVVTGDGDALSIGGNHLLHTLRRNVDLKILLFNNQIYGLTKGQYSPTSEQGKRTKSTPMGSVDRPIDPLRTALSAGATFVARTIDREPRHLQEILRRAAEHKGTAFVEIYQNCNIFNDGAYSWLTDRKSKGDFQLHLAHGEPLVFGPEDEWAVVQRGFRLAVVERDEVEDEEIVRHDEAGSDDYHYALAGLGGVDTPTPIGVLRQVTEPTYDALVVDQVEHAEKSEQRSFQELLRGRHAWTVDDESSGDAATE